MADWTPPEVAQEQQQTWVPPEVAATTPIIPRSGAQMEGLEAREVAQSPEVQKAVESVAKAAPEVISAATQAANPITSPALNAAGALSEQLTPEPVKEFMRTPLVSPETVDVARRALQYPGQTLSNVLFGQTPTVPEEKGVLGQAGQFASQQIAGQATPENLAAILGTEGLGAAEKVLTKRAPTLADTLFGRAAAPLPAAPEVQPRPIETEQAAKEVIQNATQQRNIEENRVVEHPRDDTRGLPAEAGGGGGVVTEAPVAEQGQAVAPEKITASAFKLPTGEVVNTGALHGNLPVEGAEPGFITTTGRFVNRDEAGKIATGMSQPLRAEDFYEHTDVIPSLAEHPIAKQVEDLRQDYIRRNTEVPGAQFKQPITTEGKAITEPPPTVQPTGAAQVEAGSGPASEQTFYHGSRTGELKPDATGMTYFSTDKGYAGQFQDPMQLGNAKAKLFQGKVDIRNPKEYRIENEAEFNAFTQRGINAEQLKKEGYDSAILTKDGKIVDAAVVDPKQFAPEKKSNSVAAEPTTVKTSREEIGTRAGASSSKTETGTQPVSKSEQLFAPGDIPFNLRGEEPPTGVTTEGTARAKAEATAEQARAQPELAGMPEAERPTIAGKGRETAEERALREEYERGTLEDFEQHMGHGGDELVDAVKSLGGIKADSPNFKDLTEEFRKSKGRGYQFSNLASGEKVKYGDIFRKDAVDEDKLILQLRAKGFDIENAGQLADLLDTRFRTGKKVFGMEARSQEPDITGLEGYAMGAAGTKEIPLRGWKDMIDAGEMPGLHPGAEASAGQFVGKVLDTIGKGMRNMRDFITVDPVPKLSRSGLADAAYEHASARNSVVHSVRHLLSRVFPDEYKNPAVMKQTGDILTKDNILGVYDQAKAAGDAEAMQKIEAIHDLAAYDKDVQAAKNDPRIAANIERWKQWVNPEMDRMYNEIKGYDPWTPQEPRGRHFEARINLLPKDQAAEIAKFTDTNQAMPDLVTSNYRNPNVKRDPFMRKATGTGQYETDPGAILTNSLGRRYNEITKTRLYDAVEKTGNGFITEAGERPPATEINGEPLTRLAIKMPETNPETGRTRVVEKSLWIKNSLARETRDVLNTDLAAPSNPVFRGLTQLQLLQAVDMTAHMKNIHTVVANSLGASKGWQDAIRKFPFISTADTVGRIASVTKEVMADTPAMRDEIAQMAKQGMIRPSYPVSGIQKITKGQQMIHSVDTASRIVMNRFWDNLVDRGYVTDSMQGRRAFVNQIGEYNRRLLGSFTRNLRDYGASPFIVAGRTFNKFSKRLLLGDPGFKAATPQAWSAARAYQLSGLTMATTIPAIINYFTTGKFGGRPGVPIGAIDTGTNNDKGDKKIIDLMQLMGIRRGLRATGLGALIEGAREGKSPNLIGGKMIEDITTTMSHPWIGPGLGAIYSGISGKRLDLRGGAWPYAAKQLPEGGLKQYGENLRVTLKNQNPLLYGLVAPLVGETEDTYGEGLARGFLKASASTIGYQEKPGESAFPTKKGGSDKTGRGR